MIPQIIFMYWWTDWAPLCLSLLQDSHCPRELPCFWFSPPGCLWLAHSISHLFSPLFWAISAWSACQHILSTLRCFSPTWNEGVQLKAWRKRLDRTRYLWNSTHWGFFFFFFSSADLKLTLDLEANSLPQCFHVVYTCWDILKKQDLRCISEDHFQYRNLIKLQSFLYIIFDQLSVVIWVWLVNSTEVLK